MTNLKQGSRFFSETWGCLGFRARAQLLSASKINVELFVAAIVAHSSSSLLCISAIKRLIQPNRVRVQ
jgi:hypothetical protein